MTITDNTKSLGDQTQQHVCPNYAGGMAGDASPSIPADCSIRGRLIAVNNTQTNIRRLFTQGSLIVPERYFQWLIH